MQLTETTTVLGLTGALLVAVAAASSWRSPESARCATRSAGSPTPVLSEPATDSCSAPSMRGESRTYAKGVVGGASDATLTPEEQQALAAARTGSQKA